ncbi:neurosecretory protein VGF isoform X1 [Podarcis muralis]
MGPPTWARLEVQKRPPSPAALQGAERRQRSPGERARERKAEPGGRTQRLQRGGADPRPPAGPAATEPHLSPRGRMPCLHHLRRAAWLLSLCLLLAQSHLRAAALPTGRGQEEEARPGGGGGDNDRESPQPENSPAGRAMLPGPLGPEDQKRGGPDEGDLFQDVDPKALAAVLLQALQAEADKPSGGQSLNPEPSANEERVRSETKSSDAQEQPEKKAQGPRWEAGEDGGRKQEELEEEGGEAGERSFGQQELDALKSMLEELQRYSSAAKRAEPPQGPPAPQERDDVLKELEEYERLRAHAKRSPAPPGGEPWDGARKLRQQQHLEHQLLQRRYEELAESRRQAEEARRAAAEEERLADMASDLLLQYLLKDGEEEEEDGRQGANAQEEDEDDEEEPPQRSGIRRKGSGLLFEDEEGNVAEDKRSNEAPVEEDDDDIDPNTIDRLIELSSKLHLPADDVIDIINNVEKKKKEVPEVAPAGSKAKGPGAPPLPPPRNKPKKAPAYAVYRPEPRPPQKPYYPPADYKSYHHHRLPKQNEAAWNEVLKGDEYPAPKWYPARPSGGSSGHRGGGGGGGVSNYAGSNKISNYINPRTFQPPPYARFRGPLPGPVVPREEFYDDGPAREEDDDGGEDEELQNYIETMLMKRPKAFQ